MSVICLHILAKWSKFFLTLLKISGELHLPHYTLPRENNLHWSRFEKEANKKQRCVVNLTNFNTIFPLHFKNGNFSEGHNVRIENTYYT